MFLISTQIIFIMHLVLKCKLQLQGNIKLVLKIKLHLQGNLHFKAFLIPDVDCNVVLYGKTFFRCLFKMRSVILSFRVM